jgi:hypothetical protein
MMKIVESVKAEVEAAVGQKVPDPQSAAFEKFFETLAREHPDLAKKLEDALEVTEPFPEEEAKRDAERRESIAATFQRVFFKEVWGHQALNRRALTFILFFVMFGVMATSWGIMLLRKPNQSLAQVANVAQESTTNSAQSSLSTTPPTETTVPTPTTENLDSNNLLLVPDNSTQIPKEENVPPRTLEVPPAPPPSQNSLPLYTGPVPTETNVLQNYEARGTVLSFEKSNDVPSQSSVLAFEDEQRLEPVTVFEAQPASREPVLAFESVAPVQSANVLAESFVTPEEAFETTTPLTDETDANGEGSSVLAFEPSDEDDSSLELPHLENAPPSEFSIPETGQQSDTEPLLDTATLEPNAVSPDLLQVGSLIPATLTKDVVLTAGETRQVIADSEAAWCGEGCPRLRWLGEATLLESGRLEVVFKQVVIDDKVIEINGTAFGEDNAQGLPAHIADATPTLLADLLRSGAGGVTDYVQAQTNQQTVTEQGDTTVTEQNVPALLDFILGRAASAVEIPEGDTNVIRLAAVQKGTRLEVLYVGKR